MKKLIAVLLLAVGTIFTAAAQNDNLAVLKNWKTGRPIPYGGKQRGGEIMVPTSYLQRNPEFRGVWVATVENIDFPKHSNGTDFERDYLAVVNTLQKLNCNAIIFQVRPNNDAFYPSKLNPWSRWLTGKEGTAPGNFDPLIFMINEAHKRGLEFHAWLNPYRVTNSTPLRKDGYLATLAPNNFARKRPDLVMEIPLENNKYQLILNPGEPEVIAFVVATVKEILDRYPVDAIHFDDYFYPYSGMGNQDAETFKKYRNGIVSIDNWRRNNVDRLIFSLRKTIDSHNEHNGTKVQLGISPFGIWANQKNNPLGSLTDGSQSFYRQHADTRQWIKRNWIDYIIPQLYWPFGRDVAPYAALADWWAAQVRGTNVNLYIGMAAYQVGGANEMWQNPDEFAAQMRFNSARKNIKGEAIFSYRNIANPANEIQRNGVRRILEKYWRNRASAPATQIRR